MLAYVFVHQPAEGVDPALYGDRLAVFHASLRNSSPPGFGGSWVWRTEIGPFGAAFEDWYLVDGWAALGALNTAAVTGPRKAPHDAVALWAGHGGGRLRAGVRGADR